MIHPTIAILIIFISVFSSTKSIVIPPTITNATGDYYIANKTSFINNTIECNTSKACYIICPLAQSCNNTKISCNSALCDLTCSASQSCWNSQFHINNNNNTSVNILCTSFKSCFQTNINAQSLSNISTFTTTCNNISACYNNSYTINNFQSVFINHKQCNNCYANKYNFKYINNINILQNASNELATAPYGWWNIYNITNSNNINMSCSGEFACVSYEISINNTQNHASLMNINCSKDESNSCIGIFISQSTNDKLNLNCKDTSVCQMAHIIASPISKHTHIICNGNIASQSCNGLNISVPYNYDIDFVTFEFINDYDTNIAYDGSFDNVIIHCLDHKLCTNYTTFPLLYGTAQPSKVNKNIIYYNGNISYKYQFQSLLCANGQECVFNCSDSQSCANSFIQCEIGSKCNIFCNDTNECERMIIKAYGDDINLQCTHTSACNNAKIWLPNTFTNGYLDVSSCDKYESCNYLNFMCMNENNFNYNVSSFNWNGGRYICENENCCPWNTQTNNTYKNITCTDTNCNINCDNNWGNPYYPPFGCSGLMIDATQSNTLNLNCSSGSSCQHSIIYCPKGDCNIICGVGACINATIYGDGSDNVNIDCIDTNSCKMTNINMKNINKFNLNCISDCNNANIVIETTNEFDMICNVCNDMNLWLHSNISRIICDGNTIIGGCRNAVIHSFSGDNFSLLCNDSFSCDNTTIISNLTENIFIDCSYNGFRSSLQYACSDVKIYANTFNNLDIKCNKSSCIDTYIEANGINTLNSNISLQCYDYEACTRLQLNTYMISYVNIGCISFVSCDRSIFNTTNATRVSVMTYNNDRGAIGTMSDVIFNISFVKYVLFNFDKGQGGPIINVNNINKIDVICNTSNGTNYFACDNLKLYANNIIDSVNILCDGDNACHSNEYMVENVNNIVYLWCNEDSACNSNKLKVINNVNNLNVSCNGHNACDVIVDAKYANLLNVYSDTEYIYGNYYKLKIITPQKSNSTNIYCFNTGCWSEDFIITNKNGLSDINFIWGGNCLCNSVTSCINQWNITCMDGSSSTFVGYKCYGDSKCCTKNDINRIEKSFNDYYRGNISHCYETNDNHKLSGVVIALIIICVFIAVFILVIAVLLILRKRKIDNATKQEKYQQINAK